MAKDDNSRKRDILSVIRERRSVRIYKKKLPSEEEIEKVLEAGRWAPSGLNNQPWRFLLISDKAKKDGLAQYTKYGDIIKGAPLVIIVCMDVADSYNRDKDLMAIGACIQNMLLQVHSMGLGACWLGEITNRKRDVSTYLKLQHDLELMAVLTIGYSNEGDIEGCRKNVKALLVEPEG